MLLPALLRADSVEITTQQYQSNVFPCSHSHPRQIHFSFSPLWCVHCADVNKVAVMVLQHPARSTENERAYIEGFFLNFSPLASVMDFYPEICRSLDIVSFSDHSLKTLQMIVWENPRRSAVLKILSPARLAPPKTTSRSKSLKSPFFPAALLGLKVSRSSCLIMSACLQWH